MNQLEIRRLSKSFGAVRAVDNVNLEVFAVEGAFENITPDDWPLLRG
jgi:ABC-type branched-subunit amino acid transport system ATPase component